MEKYKCEKCGCPLVWFGLGEIFHTCRETKYITHEEFKKLWNDNLEKMKID